MAWHSLKQQLAAIRQRMAKARATALPTIAEQIAACEAGAARVAEYRAKRGAGPGNEERLLKCRELAKQGKLFSW